MTDTTKKPKRPLPTAERLHELFVYNPDDGTVKRRIKHNRMPAGSPVGFVGNGEGHLVCRVDGNIIGLHRVIWMMIYGCWPPELVDHINQNPADNRLSNLRLADRKQNGWNRKSSNPLGRGVKYNKGAYVAQIRVNRKPIYLGRFASPEEARNAFNKAAITYFGEYASLSKPQEVI